MAEKKSKIRKNIGKVAVKAMAIILTALMVLGIAGTLIYYIIAI